LHKATAVAAQNAIGWHRVTAFSDPLRDARQQPLGLV